MFWFGTGRRVPDLIIITRIAEVLNVEVSDLINTAEIDTPIDVIVVDDDEPHIGLFNVSQRLMTLSNGTLTITPRDGGGAVVTIWLPDDQF